HRDAFLQALVARDSAQARRAVDAALEGGLAIGDIYLDVLRPALYRGGPRWALGNLNVAQEHYATAVAQSLLDRLSERRELPPKDGRLALVTGTPDEQHALRSR